VELPDELARERYCLLSTHGRVTGRRHTAELWFVPTAGGVYIMSSSGGLTQWCLNLQAEQQGVVRVGEVSWLGRASFLRRDDPDRTAAIDAFHAKYDAEGEDRRAAWMRDAQVVQLVLVRQLER